MKPLPTSTLTKRQKMIKEYTVNNAEYGQGTLKIHIRYDDECGNGHNSFAITGELKTNKTELEGCIHKEISALVADKQITDLIKWHLVSSDGPMHYIANTTFLASDKDHNGLRAGEYRMYTKEILVRFRGRGYPQTKIYSTSYMYNSDNPKLIKSNERQEAELKQFTENLVVPYEIVETPVPHSISEGKAPDLDAARRTAIWPDATAEQLQDKDALAQRLLELMEQFKADVEALGFTY